MLTNITAKVTQVDPGPVRFSTEIPGLVYDFNLGGRVQLPGEGYSVKFTDLDTGEDAGHRVFGITHCSNAGVYFRRYRIEVSKDGQKVWTHDYDAHGKKVHIELLGSPAMGDTLAMMPHVEAFRKKWECEVYVSTLKKYADILQQVYPELHFITADMEPLERPFTPDVWNPLPKDIYASYYYDPDFANKECQKGDIRQLGMLQSAANSLGVDRIDEYVTPIPCSGKSNIKIDKRYVCISTVGSSPTKEWQNDEGWVAVIRYLKKRGYKTVCMDGWEVHKKEIFKAGCIDMTGLRPLQERVDLLHGADFMIGIGSGLSWLAWACGKPVVLISGFSLPLMEFNTPYRIINTNVCHGCWHDMDFDKQPTNFCKCFRHEYTARQWECTKSITPEMVTEAIDRLIEDHNLDRRKKQ